MPHQIQGRVGRTKNGVRAARQKRIECMETSKKESTQRQLQAAITHFKRGDLDCAITLSAAAEGMLPDTDDIYLFKGLRAHDSAEGFDFNLVINWLKHPGDPKTATLSEAEATIVIARAITKFIAVHYQSCETFEAFLRWGHQAGHLPRLFALHDLPEANNSN